MMMAMRDSGPLVAQLLHPWRMRFVGRSIPQSMVDCMAHICQSKFCSEDIVGFEPE